MDRKSRKDVFDEMADKWPSTIVERSSVKQFTGGLVTRRSIANADSKGEGPSEIIRQGNNRVAYPIRALVPWLRSRCVVKKNNATAKGTSTDVTDGRDKYSEARCHE